MTAAATLAEALRPHVDAGEVPGAVVGVLRDGDVSLQALGSTRPDGGTPLAVDAVFRISSNTKPLAAALTLVLAEAGTLALTDPVERFVPELAGRRVLRRLDGPLDDTVPAERAVTVHDLLTMRLGFGFAFEADSPAVRAAAEAGELCLAEARELGLRELVGVVDVRNPASVRVLEKLGFHLDGERVVYGRPHHVLRRVL